MRPSLYLRSMLRESRGLRGRLLFFVLCLSVGVAAVVAVAGLAASLEQTIRGEARQLLAADVSVEGGRPIPAALDRILAAFPAVRRSDVKHMATIVAAAGEAGRAGRSQLVRLKVVGRDYPYYGKVGLEPDRQLSELLDAASAVVGPELLRRLGIRHGERLRIGGQDFRVAGTVTTEPDRLDFGPTIGPRVFLSHEGLARAGLEVRGSRVFYRTLLKLPEGASASEAEKVAARIRTELPDVRYYEVETFRDAQPELRGAISRAERFLGLVALLSLLVGGIGVAQTVRSWLAGRMDSIAVLKCIGMRPREIFALYLGQTMLLGLAGSLAGGAAGTALMAAAPSLLGGLLRAGAVDPWQPGALLRGIGLGIGVATLFALPPLAATRRVPPLRVLRRDVEPTPPSRWARVLSSAVLVGGVFGTALVQSRSPRLGAEFTGGLVAIVVVLSVASWLLARGVERVSRRLTRVSMRHGLAALARPGADTLGSIVALGLGTVVVLTMHLVESQLSRGLRAELPADAPTAFFADIRADQWEALQAFLDRERVRGVQSVPVVTARIAAVGGRPVSELAAASNGGEQERRNWALTREQNLTYLSILPSDNTVVEGAWWSDPEKLEVSIEREFARDIGAKVGSTISFDVQGVGIDLVVTSLRKVEWKSFRPNFFIVVEPGVLETAPQLRVAAAKLPAGREQDIQDGLAAAFPNVLLIRIREMLEKVAAVLEKVGRGIRVIGTFTVLAGIAILAGAVSASSIRRAREVALLKTLGMTRLGVVAVFATEYALIGLVAGTIGAAGAGVLAWAVLTRGMGLPFAFEPLPFAAAIGGCAILSVLAGTAASARALSRRPAEVLRGE